LSFQPGTFDLVFCVNALHHFDDPPAFVSQARRVTRAGGALAIVGMDPQTERDRWYLYDYFPGTYETDRARYPSGDAILGWMDEAGFVRCHRRLAARIARDAAGREVLNDRILQKNGTSQLSLLTEEAFAAGMARIEEALQSAERRGEHISFPTHISLPIVVGFVADGTDCQRCRRVSERTIDERENDPAVHRTGGDGDRHRRSGFVLASRAD